MSISPVSGFGTAKWIVSATAGQGTHTTIASALTSASSGDDIFIRPGTYTENLTLKAGVNLTAFGGDSFTPNVTITGKATFTGAGTVSISNIRLTTNSDFFLAVTGSANSVVNLNRCFLNCLNNTGISYTSSGVSSGIRILDCQGDIGTTGISLFTSTGVGALPGNLEGMLIKNTIITNSGATTTASTTSACLIEMVKSKFYNPFSSSSTGAYALFHTDIENNNGNATSLTLAGVSVNYMYNSEVASGTASCISVGAGIILNAYNSVINSSNANTITGAGTLNYGGLSFSSTSSGINTTTTVPSPYTVPQGGSGVGSFTAYSVLCGGTTTTGVLQNVSGLGTSGQVLTSNGAAALPSWKSSATVTWADNSGTFTAASNNGYFITAASTPTLPAAPSEGDTVDFIVDTASTCTVTGNTGQKIRIGSALSAAAGTCANNARGDSISLVYRSTGTTWFSAGAPQGTWTIT